MTSRTDPLRRLLVARGLRAFGDGYISLLLPVYLLSLGFSAFDVGIIATATLLGSGALTLLLGLARHRFRTRSLLLAAAALMAATGISFVAVTAFWPLVVVASSARSIRRAATSAYSCRSSTRCWRTSRPRSNARRGSRATASSARCSAPAVLLCAGTAAVARVRRLSRMQRRCKAMFVLYALLGAACALVYRRLPAPPPASD